jgi:hypothetical protein
MFWCGGARHLPLGKRTLCQAWSPCFLQYMRPLGSRGLKLEEGPCEETEARQSRQMVDRTHQGPMRQPHPIRTSPIYPEYQQAPRDLRPFGHGGWFHSVALRGEKKTRRWGGVMCAGEHMGFSSKFSWAHQLWASARVAHNHICLALALQLPW